MSPSRLPKKYALTLKELLTIVKLLAIVPFLTVIEDDSRESIEGF